MLPRFLPLLALPLLLAACSGDIRVSADWDPATADLAARRTFAFAPDKECGVIAPGGRSAELPTALYRERVNRALLSELMASGRAQAAPDKAQLLVAWGAASETFYESDTVAYRHMVHRNDPWRPEWYETTTYRHEEQTLTVTLRDLAGRTLWTGSVRAPEVTEATPEDREKRIRELVRRLFEKLPKPAAK